MPQSAVPEVLDLATDSDGSHEGDVEEVVDVIDDSEDENRLEVRSGAPPTRFHGYRRGRELGRGASGKVFVCNRKGCATSFAVKAVDLRRIQLSSNVEREQTKLCREVGILKSLPPHPNIVQMVDAFEEGNWYLLVLELVGGGDLFTALTSREPPRLLEREAAFVLRQLADGLTFLHGQGVMHRDLKLENILVDAVCKEPPMVLYSVKITDFGLSKAVGGGISEARSMVGTHPYIAPEVPRGSTYDFSSDLWCLGVLLYVLLAGHFPFDRIPAEIAEVAKVMGRLKASEVAKSIVSGLLQLEPTKRLSLDAIHSHAWLHEENGAESLEKPAKRQCLEVPCPAPSDPCPDVPSAELDSGAADSTLAPAPVPQEASTEVPPSRSSERAAVGVSQPLGGVLPLVEEHGPITLLAPAESGASSLSRNASLANWVDFKEVGAASQCPDVMQVHLFTPGRFAERVLGKRGSHLKQVASTVGCQVRIIGPKGGGSAEEHRAVVVGSCNQCVILQELLQARLEKEKRGEGQEAPDEATALLFIRAEAAGVVLGKQGFVIKRIGKQSGAKIQFFREEVRGQRPCLLTGALQSVVRAERHIFDLVRAVPVAPPAAAARRGGKAHHHHHHGHGHGGHGGHGQGGGPDLPRTRISAGPVTGDVVSWKHQFGWIQPTSPVDHPQAGARPHIYVHAQDILGGKPLSPGDRVSFHVYSDKTGLGAEECSPCRSAYQ